MHFCSRCVHSTSANENFVEIISWTKAAKLRNKSLSVVVEGEKKNTPKKILSVQYYIWINNYGSKPFTFQGLKQMTCNLKRHTQSTENDLVLPKVVEIFKIGPIQMYSTLLLAYGTAWKPHEPIFFLLRFNEGHRPISSIFKKEVPNFRWKHHFVSFVVFWMIIWVLSYQHQHLNILFIFGKAQFE